MRWPIITIFLWQLLASSTALAFEPKIYKNELKGTPKGVVYFNDSSVLLYHSAADNHLYRSDNDGQKWQKVQLEDKETQLLLQHPFDKDRAYALTSGKTHYATNDRGATWNSFTTTFASFGRSSGGVLSFHAEEPDHVLFGGYTCSDGESAPDSKKCKPVYYYTTTNFEKSEQLTEALQCNFGRSSRQFKQGKVDTVVCQDADSELVVSDDFFKSHKKSTGLTSVVGSGAAGKFFVVARNDEKNHGKVELYVSTDLEKWHRAKFDQPIGYNTYTILESSDHSLHIDVGSSSVEDVVTGSITGTFYTSDSEGIHFTKSLENTNRNRLGLVDIEKVEGVDGILIANTKDADNKVRSKISYDDGRTWNDLKLGGSDSKLHLHSVVDHRNVGRIFSSPAPGIIAGIGNKGSHLEAYEKGDMYISQDNGLTWKISHEHAQLYEFGDQGNVMLAAFDGLSDKAFYSLDRGNDWKSFKLESKIRPKFVFTTPDSTSLKFIVLAEQEHSSGDFVSLTIDFEGVHSRKCDFKDDFDKWYARYDAEGNPSCLMGHKQFFWRKKLDADCVVGDLYHEQHASTEQCDCTMADYECDVGFKRLNNGNCVLEKDDGQQQQKCQSSGKRPSGLRKVPGNTCKGEPPKELDCQMDSFNDKNVNHKDFTVDGAIFDYFYLKSDKEDTTDETIIMRTDRQKVFITHNQGGKWEQILKDSDVLGMIPHPSRPNIVYFLTTDQKLVVSKDRGKNFKTYKLPASPGANPLAFHKDNKDWLIFHGEKGCDSPFSLHCKILSWYSIDGGENWKVLQENVRRCGFADEHDEKLILCEKVSIDSREVKVSLISTTDFFDSSKTLFDNIIGFALEHEFVVVAAIDEKEKNSLKAYVSVDGETYSPADFPHNFKVDKQQAYTVLESVTNSIFLHVTVNGKTGTEYGTLLKSNSNGTDYVISLENVNRNEFGFVDFEKMDGLEGVAIVNEVANAKEADKGTRKKLKSRITHNDGAEWAYLSPPNGACVGSLDKCSLNLHGFTEREDYRDTFSSQSAVGIMIGVGNAGEYLTPIQEANTYITRDGGISWNEIAKGSYMWEFGDSGAIVVIVNHNEPTDSIKYSLDQGKTWDEYTFSEDGLMIQVDDIATIPSDQSRKFLLLGRLPASKGDKSVAIQLDFTGLTERQCKLEEDFELWKPSHPQLDGCLFGHETEYYRKLPEKNCFVGKPGSDDGDSGLKKILRNCTCSRQDFECDFNYVRANDGTCQLIDGYSPPDHSLVCKERPDAVEFWEPTGYRRIPLSTCVNGKELDKVESHPCPGKENQYEEKHRGLHGFALFVVIVLPIGMTAVIGVIVWDHYSKRYGQIRLGEENDDQPLFIQYLAVAVAGVVAVVSVVPAVVNTVVGQVRQRMSPRYSSRSAFRRRSYTPVAAAEAAEDDDELLRNSGEYDDDLEIHSD